jgi:hypothetical protein
LPYAYVPIHFAVKRFGRRMPGHSMPRRILLKTMGVGFDLIVYVNAQMKMARGVGAGHW